MAKYFKIANACVEFPDACNLPIPPSFAEIDYSTYMEFTQNSIPRIEPEPSTPPQDVTPDPQADTDAMLVDLEYRMTLLELGVN